MPDQIRTAGGAGCPFWALDDESKTSDTDRHSTLSEDGGEDAALDRYTGAHRLNQRFPHASRPPKFYCPPAHHQSAHPRPAHPQPAPPQPAHPQPAHQAEPVPQHFTWPPTPPQPPQFTASPGALPSRSAGFPQYRYVVNPQGLNAISTFLGNFFVNPLVTGGAGLLLAGLASVAGAVSSLSAAVCGPTWSVHACNGGWAYGHGGMSDYPYCYWGGLDGNPLTFF